MISRSGPLFGVEKGGALELPYEPWWQEGLFFSCIDVYKRQELADGLESLFSPLRRFGFPAHELAMMMTIALRFIPTLLNETERIMKAQIARGAELERGGPLKRLRAFIPVLVPLFVIVFQRADDLATAMEARNYTGGEGRTRMNPLEWTAGDSAAFVFSLLFSFLAVFLDGRVTLP